MKEHREFRHRDGRRKEEREERRRDERDDRRRDDKRREDRRRDDRDDKHRDKDRRSRDDKDHKHKRKNRSPSGEPKEKKPRRDDVNKSPNVERRSEKPINKSNSEDDNNEQSGATEKLSLSIAETNKLRAKLGLKPLTTDDDDKEKPVTTATDKPDVHAPAINIGEVKKQDLLKEKLAVLREKRRLEDTLFKSSPLGQVAEEESAAAWVERNRQIEAKKKLEAAQAKELEMLDQEFGVDSLVEKEFWNGSDVYGAKDLKGLRIEHSVNRFKEGSDVILTLKDSGVLDNEDDVLVNLNMINDEKAMENVENKKNKPAYNPYADDEFDEFGNYKEKSLLSKYDDELRGGTMKQSFVIGKQGRAEEDRKPPVAMLNSANESLKLPELLPVSDYYTHEEMANFKKPNKKMKRNVRKKVKLTAEELLATNAANEEGIPEEDAPIINDVPDKPKLPSLDEIENLRNYRNDDDDDDDMMGVDENLSQINDREWLDMELEKNSKKSIKTVTNFDSLVTKIKSEPIDNDACNLSSNSFYMNSTAEFCRTLGDFMTSNSSGPNKFKDEDYDEMAVDQNGTDENIHHGWQSVEMDGKPVEIKVEDNHVLDEEPIVDHGIAAALKLASKKGYLDSLATRQVNAPKQSALDALNYSIEDKKLDDMDDKYSGRRSKYSSSGSGPVVDFKEKSGYKPEIKLEYVDDQGREMSKKEAFRYLSHKFHGKGSGKKKLEKRMKKAEEDALMRSMSSTDTPLNTAQLLQDKQKANKVPYVILSGGKGLVSITK